MGNRIHRPDGNSRLRSPARSLLAFALFLAIPASSPARGLAQQSPVAVPNAPQASLQQNESGTAQTPEHPLAQVVTPLAQERTIEPGEKAIPLTPGKKVVLSLRLSARPINLVPALYSAGYEQLTDGDPKYGSDSGAFGERLGAALIRSTSTRVLGDGIFAAALHQDPRYYRVARGSVVHRGLISAEQALLRRSDSGARQLNYSGLLGRAASSALTLLYYPGPSSNGRVVLQGFATSIATNAGGNLVLEFLPDVIQRVPFLRKMHIQ